MKRRQYKIWSEEEIAFIKANYESMTAAEMIKKFRVTEPQFKNMIFKKGIHKKSNTGRFKKGIRVWNKAVKGIHLSPETEWKKGHLPANTLYDGAIQTRFHYKRGWKYRRIRTEKGKWEFYYRWVWMQKHGAIPKGYVVRHKDGDTLNDDINNLELVPRSEHLEINTKRRTSDGWLAGLMSHHNPELKKELLEQPEILELKRKEILIRRGLNELKKKA